MATIKASMDSFIEIVRHLQHSGAKKQLAIINESSL
jgi:hypothetical protein